MRFAKGHRVSEQRTHLPIVAAFVLFLVVVVAFWPMARIDDGRALV